MEYQKLINLLDNPTNRLSTFRMKNWVEATDNRKVVYSSNNKIEFKTSMPKSSLRDYSDAYILVKGTISIANTAAAVFDINNTNIKVLFKDCAPLKKCMTETQNALLHNVQDIDVVMSICNLLEYSENYTKTSGRCYW